MDNNIEIFTNMDDLQTYERNLSKNHGCVYLLEYGNKIKIGCSRIPYQRIRSLKNHASKYDNVVFGKIAVTKGHANYYQNEKLLHHIFEDKRVEDTELFNITLFEACSAIKELTYANSIDYSKTIKFLEAAKKRIVKEPRNIYEALQYKFSNIISGLSDINKIYNSLLLASREVGDSDDVEYFESKIDILDDTISILIEDYQIFTNLNS